ncbi:MAG: MOSC N-terminal beta barrel domain-containing protein [bacterium]
MVVSKLTIYPVKGCRGYSLTETRVTPMGLVGDREFTVLLDGERAGQKQILELIHLSAKWIGDHELLLGYPGKSDFELPTELGSPSADVDIYSKKIPTLDMGDEVAAWLSDAFEKTVRLVRAREAYDWFLPLKEFSGVHGQKQTKFIDAAPILLTNQSSLDDLCQRMDAPIPMNRFRPNIVVSDLEAYREDDLPAFNFPRLTLNRVTVCERCIVTTTDQNTGGRAKEPLRTLGKYRKRKNDYAGGIMFGIYLTPDSDGDISVGDVMQEPA